MLARYIDCRALCVEMLPIIKEKMHQKLACRRLPTPQNRGLRLCRCSLADRKEERHEAMNPRRDFRCRRIQRLCWCCGIGSFGRRLGGAIFVDLVSLEDKTSFLLLQAFRTVSFAALRSCFFAGTLFLSGEATGGDTAIPAPWVDLATASAKEGFCTDEGGS